MAMGLLLSACASVPEPPPQPVLPEQGRDRLLEDEDILLWSPCEPEQLERWSAAAETDAKAALKAAHCYLVFIREGDQGPRELAHARAGRQLAEAAGRLMPKNGTAHYLAAYLTGLEAERDQLHGLELVPIIEREALAASKLRPDIDQGGPDRMLGDLYLKAPGFPVSIGDPNKAVFHYRRAIEYGPDFYPNRLGVVEALMAEERFSEACEALHALFDRLKPSRNDRRAWERALTLFGRLCTVHE
jgi:hypothetical protein